MVIPTLLIIAGLTWMWGLIFVRYEGQQRGAQARPMLIMMSLMAGLATLYALAFIVFMMRQDAW